MLSTPFVARRGPGHARFALQECEPTELLLTWLLPCCHPRRAREKPRLAGSLDPGGGHP